MQADQCPDELMKQLLARANAGPEAALAEIDRVNSQFPNDARLPFLGGSLLAGRKRVSSDRILRAVEDRQSHSHEFLIVTGQCPVAEERLQVSRSRQRQARCVSKRLEHVRNDAPLRKQGVIDTGDFRRNLMTLEQRNPRGRRSAAH